MRGQRTSNYMLKDIKQDSYNYDIVLQCVVTYFQCSL